MPIASSLSPSTIIFFLFASSGAKMLTALDILSTHTSKSDTNFNTRVNSCVEILKYFLKKDIVIESFILL